VGGVLGALVACKPIQGYPGLERPKEEVALVPIASNHINRAVIDGREFGASGISLPGVTAELIASHDEQPYGCRPYTIVDTYGFDRCQKGREADFRKGKKIPRNAWSTHTKHRQTASAIIVIQPVITLSPCRVRNTNSKASAVTAPPMLSPRLYQEIFK
jgi:hypothetical protein